MLGGQRSLTDLSVGQERVDFALAGKLVQVPVGEKHERREALQRKEGDGMFGGGGCCGWESGLGGDGAVQTAQRHVRLPRLHRLENGRRQRCGEQPT